MILPLGKIQWWWDHSSPSIMRSVCRGNVLHAKAMGRGGRDLLHYSCYHLLPFRKSCSTGPWALEPGRRLHPWFNCSSRAWSHCTNMWFFFFPDQPVLLPSLWWSQLYHPVHGKHLGRAPVQLKICWNGGWRAWGSKHRQQETSTAITGINKESTRATAERGHHVRSQSQRMKYKCCWNREDFFFGTHFQRPNMHCASTLFNWRLACSSKTLPSATWLRRLLTYCPISLWGD